ncbi:hypothetical protein SVIO_088990 [Streptomyces violaceusniger]|uniref:Uncharacterized protein n=1 Tax=Streptomyces violaceusniger TaxID=68280 RepID=A0A4D4LGA0_STRVO|nr:hypothetical protein SVIO_088990 [Streptomyces violaceusniger]
MALFVDPKGGNVRQLAMRRVPPRVTFCRVELCAREAAPWLEEQAASRVVAAMAPAEIAASLRA